MSSEKCPSITRRLEDVIWIRDWSLEPRKPTTYRAQPSISGLKHTSAAAADMPMSLKHRHTRWNAKEPHPLVSQLGASPHTIAAYRDTFRLVLRFAKATLKRAPSSLRIEDLDVTFLSKF